MTDHLILPPQLAIKAMRSSGYKDAAHAIAELVDNSIQAGENVNECTNVEVICVDHREVVHERTRPRMHQIAVYDDASGMSADTLRVALQFGAGTRLDASAGMGKFGMGLPNASISQCTRVDVWSWQNGQTFHTYLDIEEIRTGALVQVPMPQAAELPAEWTDLLAAPVKSHGTLIVWSNLDRVNWKASKAFLKNAEMIIGRMYRFFLNEGRAQIRLVSFEDSGTRKEQEYEQYVRPCDPLYLMRNTTAPSPFDEEPAFSQFGDDQIIEVPFQGRMQYVTLRYSIATPEARGIDGGHTSIGKHTKKNIGVSVVRAGRELAMEQSFNNQHDPRERWWGIEVQFDPALDDVFGVSNNKQSANSFRNIDLDDDAAAEEMKPQEYKDMLLQDGDSRLVIYEITNAIRSSLRTMRDQITRYGAGTRTKKNAEKALSTDSPESLGTKITNQRREKYGDTGRSDVDEKNSSDIREAQLRTELTETIGLEAASEVAHIYIKQNIKFFFDEASIPGAMMFDVTSKAGTLIIRLNSRHPVTENLFTALEGHEDQVGSALTALKLMFMAWARMEDEAGDVRRQTLEDIRTEWGQIARDFIQVLQE